MKTSYRLFSIVIIDYVVLFSSSCQMSCGGFSDKYSGWVPYQKGEILRYSDGITQYIFEIDSVFITKPFKEDITLESGCYAEYHFSSNKNQYPFMEGFSSYRSGALGVHYTIYIDEQDIYNSFGFIYSLKNREFPVEPTILDTISYNTTTRSIDNVLVIKNSTNPVLKYSLEKIFVHNGKGLLGFMDVNGKEYKLVE